jgi:hypothetical protein
MVTPRKLPLRSVAIHGRNEELIGPDMIQRLSRNWDAERCENGRVKATAGFNQTTAMSLAFPCVAYEQWGSAETITREVSSIGRP